MNGFPFLSLLTGIPLLGGVLLLVANFKCPQRARALALGFSVLALVFAALLWLNFDSASSAMQYSEQHDWIPTLGAQYYLGVDGLGLLMVLLTAIVTPIALLASSRIEERASLYFGMVLLLETGLFGTFTALNFFHWFLYWELSLVPAFFLIKLWGGPRRAAAATQFFIYTMVGSVAMLLSFLAIYWSVHTFDFAKLGEMGRSGELTVALNNSLPFYDVIGRHWPVVIFAGVFLGFAVKVPLMPFHTWLPLAYAEAPTGVTMMLTGLMSKMGVYGFLRVLLPIFPDQMRMVLTPLLWLAVATIVISTGAAFAQRDLKRMFAYSSINHLGYCMLGVFALARITTSEPSWSVEKAAVLNGVMLQMFNHGLTAPILFCFIGFLEARSNGLRGLDEFGGLRKVAPVFCGLMGIAIFASLGLPGLNGFIGEFLIFKGSFPLATWATALSVLGLLVTAIFLLTVLQRVFSGPMNSKWLKLPDLTWQERVMVVPATALMFFIGVCPQFLIGKINATVMMMVDQLKF